MSMRNTRQECLVFGVAFKTREDAMKYVNNHSYMDEDDIEMDYEKAAKFASRSMSELHYDIELLEKEAGCEKAVEILKARDVVLKRVVNYRFK